MKQYLDRTETRQGGAKNVPKWNMKPVPQETFFEDTFSLSSQIGHTERGCLLCFSNVPGY